MYSYQFFTFCSTLDEVESVVITNGQFILEVLILRQEHEYL